MKQWMWILLCGIYGILLAALIVLQCLVMRGDVLRLFANILAVLLACPAVAALIVFGSGHCPYSNDVAEDITEVESIADKTEEADSSMESKIRTMEDFYVWAEQQKFSAREQEVGWLIYKGYTNRQIAQELYIAETTVKKHAGHVYEKAGVSGRKEFQGKLGGDLL